MKNFLSASLIILLTLIISAPAFAIDVIIDSEPLEMDVPPQIVDGRTLVPLRAIFEAMDATVDWNQEQRIVTGTKGDTVISLQIDNPIATINGTETTLDVPAKIIDGRTVVPVRFIAETMDAQVSWIDATRTVRIASAVYDVIDVTDGDTIVINYNDQEMKVRLIGIDSQESVHSDADRNTAAGIAASDYTKSLLEGKQVEIELDQDAYDSFGRMLAYVYIDGIMLNKTLLENGYAQIATYPPNTKYLADFEAIMAAKEAAQPLPATPTPEIEQPTEPAAPENQEQDIDSTTEIISAPPKDYDNTVSAPSVSGNDSYQFRRNEDATIVITGKANTSYTINVYYKSGASEADGLVMKTSDSTGKVSWTWHIGGRTTIGRYYAEIIDISGGESFYVNFSVID